MIVNLRPVNSFVTPGRPAGALGQAVGMIRIADEDSAGRRLLLEMTLEAQRCISRDQHALVHGPVRRMACDTSLPHCLVLEYEGTALRGVTLEAGFVTR